MLLALLLCALLTACNWARPSADSGAPQGTVRATAAPGAGEPARLALVTVTPDRSLLREAPTSYAYTVLREDGPQLLDPILAWDAGSQIVVRNVMETLVYPHPFEGDSYIPLLATGWRVSEDGRAYTFSIRRGVRFSNGNALTASDVSYSLQRLLLASPLGGSQHLILEPLLGITTTHGITTSAPAITATTSPGADVVGAPPTDITARIDGGRYAGDRAALLANVPADVLFGICQGLQNAIVADDGDGTLTIHLREPWTPLLSALSQTWTSVVDRQWAAEQGAWDGRCETWQNWYPLSGAESALSTAILGTGPYTLDFWAPGAAYVLKANPAYWHGDSPMWAGGPSGPPALSSIHVRQVTDANERWELLESGEADTAQLSRAGSLLANRQTAVVCAWPGDSCRETNTSSAPLRRLEGIPLGQRQAVFFNFNIQVSENAFLGSGELDGDGVPPDFFTDHHVRRAFAYCLDQRAFIQAGLGGDGLRVQGLLPRYIGNLPRLPEGFPYLLRLCNEELAQAWDGRLAEVGFRLQVPFESGNAAQQAVAVLLQNSLRAVNPAYRLEPIGLPSPLMHQALDERRAPLALFSWSPVLPDAYYWLAPAFQDDIASFQQLPPALHSTAYALLNQLRNRDLPARGPLYRAVDRFYVQQTPFVLLPEPAATYYQRRDVDRWLFNAADPLPYFYAFR